MDLYDIWKQHVPVSGRLYLQTLLGDRSKPFTEKDFTSQELNNLSGIITQADTNRRKEFQTSLRGSDNYLGMLDKFKNPIPWIQKTQADPEWQRLNQLMRVYDSSKMTIEQAQEMQDLKGRLFDKYSGQGIPKSTLYGMLGKDPNGIQSTFSNLYNEYAGKGQLERVQGEKTQAEKILGSGRGWVKYGDYPDKEQVFPYTALGRFTYQRQPDGSVVAKDKYDFDNEMRRSVVEEYEKMGTLEKLFKAGGFGLAGSALGGDNSLASEIGNAFIGKKGRDVNINLPTLSNIMQK